MTEFPQALIDTVERGAILVSGSRKWEPAQLSKVSQLVESVIRRAFWERWSIIVGDANGVDEMLITTAAQYSGIPLIVMGCAAVGRIRVQTPEHALTWLAPGGDKRGSCYLIRDEMMAELAAMAPDARFYGIWNGQSTGTKKTALEAYKRGILGWMLSPNVQPIGIEELKCLGKT